MSKNEAERGEMPSMDKYFDALSEEKSGHDSIPTEKELENERTAKHLLEHPEIAMESNKSGSDTAPKHLTDIWKKLALYTEKEVGQERLFMKTPYFDKGRGKMVVGEMLMKDNMDDVEFVIKDSETGEILESKNIKFMNEFPEEYAEYLDKILREGYPGEKSH